VPDAFEPVPAGADDGGRLLHVVGAITQCRKIVGQRDEAIQQVVEVLDFGNRTQAPHGHADRLPHDRPFPDAGVEHPLFAVFFLHPHECLVDAAYFTDILAEGEEVRVFFQCFVKKSVQDFVAVFCFRCLGIFG
jgi:hypothetical protein